MAKSMKNGKGSAGHKALKSGVSLEKFAQAKLSRYDKREKLRKEAALKAKKISKYRKLKFRLQKEGRLPPATQTTTPHTQGDSSDEEVQRALTRAGPVLSGSEAGAARSPLTDTETEYQGLYIESRQDKDSAPSLACNESQHQEKSNKGPRIGKRKRPLSGVQKLAKKVQAAKDQKKLEILRAKQEVDARQKRIAEVEQRRKLERKTHLKKTKRGQPVMKHRIDKLLQQLQPS